MKIAVKCNELFLMLEVLSCSCFQFCVSLRCCTPSHDVNYGLHTHTELYMVNENTNIMVPCSYIRSAFGCKSYLDLKCIHQHVDLEGGGVLADVAWLNQDAWKSSVKKLFSSNLSGFQSDHIIFVTFVDGQWPRRHWILQSLYFPSLSPSNLNSVSSALPHNNEMPHLPIYRMLSLWLHHSKCKNK